MEFLKRHLLTFLWPTNCVLYILQPFYVQSDLKSAFLEFFDFKRSTQIKIKIRLIRIWYFETIFCHNFLKWNSFPRGQNSREVKLTPKGQIDELT